MYTNDLSLNHIVSNTKRLMKILTAAIALTAISVTVQAQQNSAAQNLLTQVQESNAVFANAQWQRVEFSKTYDNPIVVVDTLVNAIESPYVVGVRNVDTLGFEISIKSCDGADIPLQESINFLVLERNPSEPDAEQSRQHFAWGDCPV